MNIDFNGGRFVSGQGSLNYQEVLDDFEKAKTVRIMTYNISAKDDADKLFERIRALSQDVDVKVITNIPSRFDYYSNNEKGKSLKDTASRNIEKYVEKLNPAYYGPMFMPFFNFKNHGKIIGTENIVYIGSANFSNESRYNIECGIIIKDKAFIDRLYSDFFDSVSEASTPYFEGDFNVLRLFTQSMLAKFSIHLEKLYDNLYRYNSETGRYIFINEETYLSDDDLSELVYDLYMLQELDVHAENASSEDDAEYELAIGEIIAAFDSIDIDWLIEVSSTDEILYNYVNFDSNKESLDIFATEYSHEGYDEYLDEYMDKAMEDARDVLEDILSRFDEIADKYLSKMELIVNTLKQLAAFVEEYGVKRIKANIDNT